MQLSPFSKADLLTGNVRLLDRTALQAPTLSDATSNGALKLILSTLDREVRKADLVRIASDGRGHAKEGSVDLVVADLKLEVAPVVQVVPMELGVGTFEPIAVVVRRRTGNVLTVRTGRRDGTASKFYTNAAGSGV
jgi:hypothetical protein